jgi:hypothetical protein
MSATTRVADSGKNLSVTAILSRKGSGSLIMFRGERSAKRRYFWRSMQLCRRASLVRDPSIRHSDHVRVGGACFAVTVVLRRGHIDRLGTGPPCGGDGGGARVHGTDRIRGSVVFTKAATSRAEPKGLGLGNPVQRRRWERTASRATPARKPDSIERPLTQCVPRKPSEKALRCPGRKFSLERGSKVNPPIWLFLCRSAVGLF